MMDAGSLGNDRLLRMVPRSTVPKYGGAEYQVSLLGGVGVAIVVVVVVGHGAVRAKILSPADANNSRKKDSISTVA